MAKSESNLKILVIDTAAREAKLAMLTCPQPLSVKRSDILSGCRETQKSVISNEFESNSGALNNFLASFFQQVTVRKDLTPLVSGTPYSSSQTLVPRIGQLLGENGLQPDQLDLVVVALGPGSFTGLRIGVVAAKTFIYATGCNLVGLDLMSATAHQAQWIQSLMLGDSHSSSQAEATTTNQPIGVAITAGRGDVLASTYERDTDSGLSLTIEAKIWRPDDWAAALEPGTLFSGDGVDLISSSIIANKRLEAIDSCCRMPTLPTLAILGIQRFLDKGPDNHWEMQPIYSRPSSAEEKKQQVKA